MAHICHDKTYFSTAKHTFPLQNLLFHGKTYFSTAKLTLFLLPASSLSLTCNQAYREGGYDCRLASLCLQFPAILDPGTFNCTNMANGKEDRRRKKILCKYNENVAVCDFLVTGFWKVQFLFSPFRLYDTVWRPISSYLLCFLRELRGYKTSHFVLSRMHRIAKHKSLYREVELPKIKIKEITQ